MVVCLHDLPFAVTNSVCVPARPSYHTQIVYFPYQQQGQSRTRVHKESCGGRNLRAAALLIEQLDGIFIFLERLLQLD